MWLGHATYEAVAVAWGIKTRRLQIARDHQLTGIGCQGCCRRSDCDLGCAALRGAAGVLLRVHGQAAGDPDDVRDCSMRTEYGRPRMQRPQRLGIDRDSFFVAGTPVHSVINRLYIEQDPSCDLWRTRIAVHSAGEPDLM